MTRRGISIFVVTLLAFTWGIQILALIMNQGDPQADGMAPYLLASMLAPTIWAGTYLALNRQALADVAWRPGRIAALLIAPLIPVALAVAAAALISQLALGTSGYFTFARAGVEIARGPWILGAGMQAWPLFGANMAVTALTYGVLSGVVAAGEEFGWRGLLQPNMIREFGLTKGVALLGFVWASWHLPVNLAGYNYPESPMIGALVLFPVTLIAASFVLAALTIWARSFWPAALYHGAVNSVFEGIRSKASAAEGISRLQIEMVFTGAHVALAIVCGIGLMVYWRKRA